MEQEIDIKIQAAIDAVDASKTLGELKKSIKDLKSLALETEEGSKAFETLTSKIGQANDRLKDLNEVVAMKTGNNVENLAKSFAKIGSYGATSLQAVTGAMGLFGDQSEETMKKLVKLQAAFNFANGIKALVEGFDEVKKAFSVLMTSMKAMLASNPFGIILIAIVAVIGVLFLLKDAIKPIGDMFDAIGVVIQKIIQSIKDFMDWLGLTNFALKDSVEKNIKQYEKEEAAIEKRYEAEKKAAEKLSKDLKLIETKRLIDISNQTLYQIKEYERLKQEGVEFTDDEQKKYDALLEKYKTYTDEMNTLSEEFYKNQKEKQEQLNTSIINLRVSLDSNNIKLIKQQGDNEAALSKKANEEKIKKQEKDYESEALRLKNKLDNNQMGWATYYKKLEDLNKEHQKTTKLIEEEGSLQQQLIDEQTKEKIIAINKERKEKQNQLSKELYETDLKNLEYNADKTEKLYNEEYNKIKEFLRLEAQAYLSNGELINDNDISIVVAKGVRLEAIKNETLNTIDELYNKTKSGYEKEISDLELQNSKIKDKNSKKYKLNEAQIKQLQNTIEQLTINHNERVIKINENTDKILIDAKNKAYDEQIKIEEEGLNRTDVIYNLKLQKLEDNLKFEQEALKKSFDEGKILAIKYYTELDILLRNFNLDKVKLELETLKKIENGRELSNNLQIRSQAKQWNKLNNLLKAFLFVDQKEYDAALLNNLNQLEKQKNNEQKVLEDYYNTQRELHKDNAEELKRIDEQYTKDKAQIDADYEKKKQDETEAAYQAYMQQATNNLGQYFYALSSLFSNISSLVDQISEQQIAAAEEVMNKQIEAIDATANAQIAAAERDITDTVALEEAKKNITNNAVAQTLAAKNKYAKEETKLKKKQFKIEKASNIVKATMDGIMAVMQALASSPPPANAILAAISGAAAAVNIGMLASTKPPKELEGADVSGGSFTSPYTGGSGSSGSSSSPNVNAAAFYKLGQGGPNVLSNQSGMNNKVYVVESDIRKTTGRVETIERRASRAL